MWWCYTILLSLFELVSIAFVSVFVILPLAFMHSSILQNHLIFARLFLTKNKEDFRTNELGGVNNFYVDIIDKDTNRRLPLGVWHLLPWALVDEQNIDFNGALAGTDYNIFIYFHGSGETRRDCIRMLDMLRIFGHVIAFDYRGYGDSGSGKMTENAVVDDCKQLCEWVMTKSHADIYLWGHSLGASLALSTAARLQLKDGIVVDAVFLQAPFTTLREALPLHRFGKIFAWLPWLNKTILDPMEKNGFLFDNLHNIQNVDCPIKIFHATDDSVIPCRLGKKLAESNRHGSQCQISFREISFGYFCDHFYLWRYSDLPYEVRNFLMRTQCRDHIDTLNHSLPIIMKHWVLARY